MGYLKLDTDGVANMASGLESHGEAILGQLSSLAPKAAPGDMFNGAAATKYAGAYQKWERAQKDMSTAVKELGHALRVCSQNWTEVDQQGAAAFDRLWG